MIDFDKLVLSPCVAVFSKPVTITPTVSQPNAADYSARGIWEVQNVNIVTEDGGNFSNRTIKLGIRMAEFPIAPSQGDTVTVQAQYLPLAYSQAEQIDPTTNVAFVIDDQSADGQGGAMLTLKRVIP